MPQHHRLEPAFGVAGMDGPCTPAAAAACAESVKMGEPHRIDVLLRRNAERPCRPHGASPPRLAASYRRLSDGAMRCLRLPREGVTGTWRGSPGQSGWVSALADVRGVTGGTPVIFRNNFPDFTPWAQATFADDALTGTDADFKLADAYLAKTRPDLQLHDAVDAAALRQRQALTWHHHEDATTLLLVPRALHEHVPHAGGAALLRRRAWAQGLCDRQSVAGHAPTTFAPGAAFAVQFTPYPPLPVNPPPAIAVAILDLASAAPRADARMASTKTAPRTFFLRSSGM